MPPSALISSTAICAPFLTARPYTAAAPVTGPIPPILNTSPEAAVLSPAAAVVASAAAAVVVSVVEEELPHAVKDAAIAIARPRLKNLFFIMFPPLELVIMITIHCFVNLKWNG